MSANLFILVLARREYASSMMGILGLFGPTGAKRGCPHRNSAMDEIRLKRLVTTVHYRYRCGAYSCCQKEAGRTAPALEQ